MGALVWIHGINENKQYIVSRRREEGFCIEEVHGASFIIQRRRRDMREEDASVCITPALPLRCITLPGGSFSRV